MKLSDGEKLILFMLSEIYQRLEVNGDVDAELVSEALTSGQYWAISSKHSWLLEWDNPKEGVLRETMEIMTMWSVIESAYNKLTDDEKAYISKQTDLSSSSFEFRGFDLNHEGDHYGIADFAVRKMNKFAVFAGRNMNSHSRSIDWYRRMYAKYQEVSSVSVNGKLGVDELTAIMNASLAERP